MPYELVDFLEIVGRRGRARENQRERHIPIRGVEQHAEQEQDFFRRPGAARKNDNAVTETNKRLEPLLDVGQDDQLVDDGVGRLGRDDAGFGDADVATGQRALLRMTDGRAFHRTLHGAWSAAGADVAASQTQLVSDFLGVVVFVIGYGMAAPADHEARLVVGVQQPAVAEDLEYGIADALGRALVEIGIGPNLGVKIHDVTDHSRQQFANAVDDLAVDERAAGRVFELQPYPAVDLVDPDREVAVLLKHGLGVVAGLAAVEHGQRAAPQHVADFLGRVRQPRHLFARQDVEAAGGIDTGGVGRTTAASSVCGF